MAPGWRGSGVLLLCAVTACTGLRVGDPARPDFARAAGELQVARALAVSAAQPPVAAQTLAIAQIERASAAIAGAGIRAVPPAVVEPATDDVERLHYALTHLDAARGLLSRPEPDGRRRALRNDTIGAVARAEEALGRALEERVR